MRSEEISTPDARGAIPEAVSVTVGTLNASTEYQENSSGQETLPPAGARSESKQGARSPRNSWPPGTPGAH